jgi:hypothetical protein
MKADQDLLTILERLRKRAEARRRQEFSAAEGRKGGGGQSAPFLLWRGITPRAGADWPIFNERHWSSKGQLRKKLTYYGPTTTE